MASRAYGRRKRRRRRRLEDEERVSTPPARVKGDRSGLMSLQQQVGNQAVQRLLAQRQAEEQEKAAKTPVEVGEVKIEQPKIEYYEVTGESLIQVSQQILPPGEWYEVDYKPEPKLENGTVSQVDITVQITLKLPQWTGPGWEQATDLDKMTWLEMLETMMIDPDEADEEVTTLPQQWLLGPGWAQAPQAVKGEWQAMLQSLQSREQSPLDAVRRRALVLQQRLLKQPEQQIKTIVDQFMKEVKVEQEMYSRQLEFGQVQDISLGANTMVR